MRWVRARSPVGRSVGLGLCSRKNTETWKRRRMALAEIPMPISEKKAFLKLAILYSLFLFILWKKEAYSKCLWRKERIILYDKSHHLHQSQLIPLPLSKYAERDKPTAERQALQVLAHGI
jgi:hypothetical protein